MILTYAEDLQSDAFDAEEYVERLAWRLTSARKASKVDAGYLITAMEEEISNLQILFDQCMAKVTALQRQRDEEEEAFYASLEQLRGENEVASTKLGALSERVSSISARVVHLGDQLQTVIALRTRAYDVYELMMHFNEFLSDQPLESDVFTDPDKLVEAGDVIHKLHAVATELPTDKYGSAQSRIAYKYDEIEKMLVEEFVRCMQVNMKHKMKQIAHVLSQFRDYNQCIDAYVEHCQWQAFRGQDILADIWSLVSKCDQVITEVFPDSQQVMSRLVLNIFQGKLQEEVANRLPDNEDMETYLVTLYDFYSKIETTCLQDQCKFLLLKFYEAVGHTKRSTFASIHARLMADSRSGETLLSEEVAINMLQETKQAFARCVLLSPPAEMLENVRKILAILTQYLLREHVEYAVELALAALPSQESGGQGDFVFFSLLRQVAAIGHLFDRQIDDSVRPLLQKYSEGEACLGEAKHLLNSIETKLDKGVDRLINVIIAHVKSILSSEQKRQDFRPDEGDQYNKILTCSNACSLICKYMTQQISNLSDSLDGCNLENALAEVVLRFHRVIVDHIYQFHYNSQGAVLLLCDVSEYRKTVSGLGVALAKRLFDTLHALCNLLIVAPEHLASACTSAALENIDRSVLNCFVQLRMDYKSARLTNLFLN